jgi:prolipoprotein diacylglyceryltransferase
MYGVLRFGIEFLRVAEPVRAGLTAGQVVAVVQLIIGLVFMPTLRWRVKNEDD